MDEDSERSEYGSPILRHGMPSGGPPCGIAQTDEQALASIEHHIRAYVGEPLTVYHEVVSRYVHLDVHIVPPSATRDCYTFITSGMSDLPMIVPDGAEEFCYAELMLSVAADWGGAPIAEWDLSDERLYWPIRLLKDLARLPHTYESWLGYGHTVPNGDPPRPYASDTDLCCALVLPPLSLDPAFACLRVRPDKDIHFYGVVPIYASEMHYKLKRGTDALVEGLDRMGVSELLNPRREAVSMRKRFLLF